MPKLIRLTDAGAVIGNDDWTLLRDPETETLPASGDVIVPLALWQTRREALEKHAGRVGVWLAADQEPAEMGADVANLPLIAIDFPQFADGRGYSSAKLLRERYNYRQELRAIGDVQRDQLYYLSQVGFNAFAIRSDRNPESEIAGLSDFSTSYRSRGWGGRRVQGSDA